MSAEGETCMNTQAGQGKAGTAIWRRLSVMLAMVLAASTGRAESVCVNSWDSGHFDVKSGAYRIHYNADKTNGLILTGRDRSRKEIFLNFGMDTLAIFSKKNLKDIVLVDTDKYIDVAISSSVSWADFQSYIRFYKDKPGLINWKLNLHTPAGIETERWRFAGDFKPVIFFALFISNP